MTRFDPLAAIAMAFAVFPWCFLAFSRAIAVWPFDDWRTGVLPFAVSLIGAILGSIAEARSRRSGGRARTLAVSAKWIGIVSCVVGVAGAACLGALLAA